MLTTVDNPFNPFTQFKEWFAFDIAHSYNTASLLARILVTSTELSEAQQLRDTESAIDEIVRMNVSGMHRKVSAESWPEPVVVPYESLA